MLGTSNLSFFIKTSNISNCENRRCHPKKGILSVNDKSLNNYINSPN